MQPLAAADTAVLAFSALMLMLGVQTVSGMEAAQLLSLGDKAYSAGEYSSAVRHYTNALDKDAAAAMIYTKRAAAYMSLRQHMQALRDLDRWGAALRPLPSAPCSPPLIPTDVHCLLDPAPANNHTQLAACPHSLLPPWCIVTAYLASKQPLTVAGGCCFLCLPNSTPSCGHQSTPWA
jgi:tetratricopeptide (TPR) repeat protein